MPGARSIPAPLEVASFARSVRDGARARPCSGGAAVELGRDVKYWAAGMQPRAGGPCSTCPKGP